MCPQYIAGQIGLGDRKSVTEKRESGCRQTPKFSNKLSGASAWHRSCRECRLRKSGAFDAHSRHSSRRFAADGARKWTDHNPSRCDVDLCGLAETGRTTDMNEWRKLGRRTSTLNDRVWVFASGYRSPGRFEGSDLLILELNGANACRRDASASHRSLLQAWLQRWVVFRAACCHHPYRSG